MAAGLDRIVKGDCIKAMQKLDADSVHLAFADPPFNIGYDYDEYDDKRSSEDYLDWSKKWMGEVKRVLRPDGTFWLAIGDEYAAELKVIATRELGLTCRNWVVWYYTFGVHCKTKFTRSHAHLFYFVKDAKQFTFNDMAVRVPSARMLVYGDKRADPKGRMPDDTWIMKPTADPSWILRPQDLPEGFEGDGDTWFYSRVCGTFKERKGFHGCQMPEQLLGRIMRSCSNEGDTVLDPFSGSATTLAVAKKLNRRFIGMELSEEYVTQGRRRLKAITPGDPLDGPENPLLSAPSSANGVIRDANGQRVKRNGIAIPAHKSSKTSKEIDRGIIDAFSTTHQGYSTDWLLVSMELRSQFRAECKRLGLQGEVRAWISRLVGLRKSGRHPELKGKSPHLNRAILNDCRFASEFALNETRKEHGVSLDEILCNDSFLREFDQCASTIMPDQDPTFFRWEALNIRKRGREAPKEIAMLTPRGKRLRFHAGIEIGSASGSDAPDRKGVYLLAEPSSDATLYVGFANDLGNWLENTRKYEVYDRPFFRDVGGKKVLFRFLAPPEESTPQLRGRQYYEIFRSKPRWNDVGMATACA